MVVSAHDVWSTHEPSLRIQACNESLRSKLQLCELRTSCRRGHAPGVLISPKDRTSHPENHLFSWSKIYIFYLDQSSRKLIYLNLKTESLMRTLQPPHREGRRGGMSLPLSDGWESAALPGNRRQPRLRRSQTLFLGQTAAPGLALNRWEVAADTWTPARGAEPTQPMKLFSRNTARTVTQEICIFMIKKFIFWIKVSKNHIV